MIIHKNSKTIVFSFIVIWLFFVSTSSHADEMVRACEKCRGIPEPILAAVKTSDFIVKAEILKVSPPPYVEAHSPPTQTVKYGVLKVYRGGMKPGSEIWVGYYLSSDTDYIEQGELSKAIFKPGNTVYAMLRGNYSPNGMVTTLHQASGAAVLEATESNTQVLDAIFEIFPKN